MSQRCVILPIMSIAAVTRSLAFTVAFLLLMATACKSDLDQVIDWYEETSPSIRPGLPTASECGRWENDYWWAVGLMDQASDRFAQEVILMHQRNAPERERKIRYDAHLATIRSINQGFLNSTGLTEQQSGYCEGRFEAERNPGEMCPTFSKLPLVLPAPTSAAFALQYGATEYCIENSISPFH